MTWPWQVRLELGVGDRFAPSSWVDAGRLRDVLQFGRGRTSEQDQDTPGELVATIDNRAGAVQTGIEPGRAVRVMVDSGSGFVPLWTGVVESGPAVWPTFGDAVVQLSASDAMSELAYIDVDMERGRELSGSRIGGALDAAGWPSGLRDIDAGQVTVDVYDEDDPRSTMWPIRDAVNAEDGQISVAGDGSFTFRDRHSRLNVNPSAQFGIDDPMVDLSPQFDNLHVVNVARVSLADGRIYEAAVDGVSQVRRREVRDLISPSYEAVAFAQWQVYRFATPRLRFSSLLIESRKAGVLPLAVGLNVGDVVRVFHDPEVGSSVDELCHIEQVSHRITPGSWRTTYELSPYFGEGPWGEWADDVATGDGWWLSDAATSGPRWAP